MLVVRPEVKPIRRGNFMFENSQVEDEPVREEL